MSARGTRALASSRKACVVRGGGLACTEPNGHCIPPPRPPPLRSAARISPASDRFNRNVELEQAPEDLPEAPTAATILTRELDFEAGGGVTDSGAADGDDGFQPQEFHSQRSVTAHDMIGMPAEPDQCT